jgi:hypothetical protein
MTEQIHSITAMTVKVEIPKSLFDLLPTLTPLSRNEEYSFAAWLANETHAANHHDDDLAVADLAVAQEVFSRYRREKAL